MSTTCQLPGGGTGTCRGGVCAPPGCGDRVVNDTSEECDDGNAVSGDGCEPNCRWSCTSDDDCEDGDVCNGVARCVPETHRCADGTPLVCEDAKACTVDSCHPESGCQHVELDEDGDSHSCAEDCDDKDPARYVGAPEYCDEKDNDCNEKVDDGEVVKARCYPDTDDDGHGPLNVAPSEMCVCPSGFTINAPTSAQYDCHDGNRDVHPAQTGYFATSYCSLSGVGKEPLCRFLSWDYNCDGVYEKQYPNVFEKCTAPLFGKCCCSGWKESVPACGGSGTYVSCTSAIKLGACAISEATAFAQPCR